MENYNLLIQYVNENNKVPSKKEKYKGYKLGSYYSNLKKNVININSAIYIQYQEIPIIKDDFDRFIKLRNENNN